MLLNIYWHWLLFNRISYLNIADIMECIYQLLLHNAQYSFNILKLIDKDCVPRPCAPSVVFLIEIWYHTFYRISLIFHSKLFSSVQFLPGLHLCHPSRHWIDLFCLHHCRQDLRDLVLQYWCRISVFSFLLVSFRPEFHAFARRRWFPDLFVSH